MVERQRSCVFCAIVSGDAAASIVHVDDRVIAFMDIHPFTAGHLLVAPKAHRESLGTLDPDDGAAIFCVAQSLAAALRMSGLPCAGVNLVLADGEAAGQDVFHVHLHVVPRYQGDGFGFVVPPRHGPASRPELDATAALIRDAASKARP